MGDLLAVVLLSGLASAAPGPEMRGLWVVRTGLTSPAAVDRVVDEAHAAGFNALFVQVRGRGDAFYASKIASRSVLLHGQPASFDPLQRLIDRARTKGLKVHGWVNVLLASHFGPSFPKDHVLALHPEWVMVPRSIARAALTASPRERLRLVAKTREEGDVEGYYLSPAAPGVPEHLEAVVRELVTGYELEGLHFDFVRYPGPEYDYSRAALEGFRRQMGRRDLLDTPNREPSEWSRYRRDVLTALTDRLSRAARAERPGLLLSAAVVADEAQALHHKYQDWPAWVERGVLDALCPMTYTPDGRLFRRQIELARERMGRHPLWAGVGAYRLPVGDTIERIQAARESGAAGVLVFSHESFSADDLRRLRVEAFPAFATGAHASGVPAVKGDPR